jgi:hypothetical protein
MRDLSLLICVGEVSRGAGSTFPAPYASDLKSPDICLPYSNTTGTLVLSNANICLMYIT